MGGGKCAAPVSSRSLCVESTWASRDIRRVCWRSNSEDEMEGVDGDDGVVDDVVKAVSDGDDTDDDE